MRGIETLMSDGDGVAYAVKEVAQVAHNFLTLQILPHLDGSCSCRKRDKCELTVRRNVRYAAKAMRASGARER